MSDNAAFSLPDSVRVVVVSGPSGCGKTTIVERLIDQQPVPLVKTVSATTRPPRRGEADGVSYYFLSVEEFRQRLERGEFIEYAEVFRTGNLYGTLQSEVARAARQGAWALLEIDVQGAMQVVARFPEAVTIFIRTPSEDVFEARLRARGTESDEIIQRRVATAREELKAATRYKYQVVNDDLDVAVKEVADILLAEQGQSDA